MASRKEQKEALRREREERERRGQGAEQRKRLIGYGAAGGVALVASSIVRWCSSLGGGGDDGGGERQRRRLPRRRHRARPEGHRPEGPRRRPGCSSSQREANSARPHQDLAEKVKYAPTRRPRASTTGPGRGRRLRGRRRRGARAQLEHGRVIIWFKPTCPGERADLKALFDEDTYQMVLTPRQDMTYQVAATRLERRPGLGTGPHAAAARSTAPRSSTRSAPSGTSTARNGPETVP